MSNSRTWLPLVGASAVLGLAALIFFVLLQEDADKGAPAALGLSQSREERQAPPSELQAPAVQRDTARQNPQVLSELGTEDGSAFRNKVRFFVTSPDGVDRLAAVKVELREVPMPFAFAAALGGGGALGGVIQTGVTDASGSFAFFDVPKREVKYEIRAFHPDYAPASLELAEIPAQGETPEYELRMREGFRLHGRVLAKGTEVPIDEARLIVRRANNMAVLLGASSSEPAENDLVVNSDAGGYFDVKNAPVGSVEIVVKAKGYAEIRATELLDETLLPNREKEVTFHLGVGGEVSGRVETQDGAPLPGAEVVARRTENNQTSVVTGKSGADGKFRLEGLIESEEYFLSGQKSGFIAEGQTKAKSGDQEIVIRMTQSGRVVGKALRASSSRPLRQFTATIVSYREVPKEAPQPQLSADQKASAANAGEAVTISGDEQSGAGGKSLGFGTVLEGQEAPAAASAAPARNPYAIYGNSPVIYTELRQTQRIIESRDGSFELDGVVAQGTYVVRIEASGLAPAVSQPFQCEKGVTVNVGDILLDAGGVLEGTVIDSLGAPVAKALVSVNCAGADPTQNPINKILGPIGPQPLQRKSAVTDEQGRYRVEMLIPTPSANLVVTKLGFADGDPVETPVLAGQTTSMPPIILKSGGGIFGVVLKDGVAPMSGMKVSIRPSEQQGGSRFFSRDTVTGHDGKFEFAGIPAGKYKIHTVSSNMDGVNPFGTIIQIRQTEQEVEVEDAMRREVTLSVPTTPAVPGVMPTFPPPGQVPGAQGDNSAAAAEKLQAQNEAEAARLKKKMQETQRSDDGSSGDGTGSDGGG
ncbi:MAG: carboxypeptidase regulatory-like domain-containing protein [Planctomycetes bacterium]|nr:carboxypeptidase regulatory-like domain-containing protein [Planctomycetota bacterium]